MRTTTAVLLCLVSLSACGDGGPSAAERAAQQAANEAYIAEAFSTNVLYEVGGTTDYADVTYVTPDGIEQSSPDIPLTIASGSRRGEEGLLVGPFQPGDFVSISAQNNRATGTITCTITTEDGTVIAENSSRGAYAIVTCEGSVR